MRKLKFKSVKARNFLCFGEEGIELNFDSYGPIVSVTGRNYDVLDDNDKTSNGTGKSSMIDLLVYGLFGKTVKKPKKMSHADVINLKSEKDLYVEVLWDEYRVVRTRTRKGSGSLKLWRSDKGEWSKDTEITKGGMPATQEAIESIIGLNYDTFVNIFAFTDDISACFLECDGPTKREIVENLLSLSKYRGYHEAAKESLKSFKDAIKLLSKEYERMLLEASSAIQRIARIKTQAAEWKASKEKELDGLSSLLSRKEGELGKTDDGAKLLAYEAAQEEISQIGKRLPELARQRDDLSKILIDAEPKCLKLSQDEQELSVQQRRIAGEIAERDSAIARHERVVRDIRGRNIKECPVCEGDVTETKVGKILSKSEAAIASEVEKKTPLEAKDSEIRTKLDSLRAALARINDGIRGLKAKIADIDASIASSHRKISQLSAIKAPDVDKAQLVLQEQIKEVSRQIGLKRTEIEGKSPFADILDSAVKESDDKRTECEAKKAELDRSEHDVPYYDFWTRAFGDSGIRKYIIDGIVPALNSRAAYWLQYLVDSRIRIKFDNKLDEEIDKYPFSGKPYAYYGMSGGQRRRLNLAVSQAFAYIRELNSGASPSVVWLDEVTMNMDESGVQGIYSMICELSKDKQVFVIDHNPILLKMLEGYDKISLEMRGEVTTMR